MYLQATTRVLAWRTLDISFGNSCIRLCALTFVVCPAGDFAGARQAFHWCCAQGIRPDRATIRKVTPITLYFNYDIITTDALSYCITCWRC